MGALSERVQTARERMAHQYDPALTEALSEGELAADREVAERIREHARRERVAQVEAAESTAEQVRRATAAILRADAQDLVLARRALADQRRESSPHAQLAHLYQVKKWCGRGLAGVVVAAMVWSAINVQHNIAPAGASDPLYWASYLLEALISTVLVVFMISGSAVARWKVDEGAAAIRWTEVFLLAATITLNTYPYLNTHAWFDAAVHAVAPVMIGVALIAHDAVSRRLGTAIARASAQVPDSDDITERLADLSRVSTTAPQPVPAPAAAAELDTGDPVSRVGEEASMAEFEREFADRAPIAEATPVARAPIAARAEERTIEPARVDTDRAPVARDEQLEPRAADRTPRSEITEPIAIEDASPIAIDNAATRKENAPDPAPIARDEDQMDRAPRAAHNPADLVGDRAPIADHSDETAPVAEDLDGSDPEAARDRRAVVTLVRATDRARSARGSSARTPRAGRAPIARETPIDGALARAADRAPIARDTARGATGSGPFARSLSRAESTNLARAVIERGRSRQPIEVLARIYEAHSQGHTATFIGKEIVGLPHSTVGRAIEAAAAISGPRAID
ncbi:hypothetical protein [Nocardia gipuzkoensis]